MEEDIKEILTALNNITKKQLDEAIANADKEWSEMEMEEDINKLQKLIDRCKECKFATCEQCEISYKEVRAIENLIARNKKLEALLEDLDWYFKNQKDNYIQKSKVKEKKKELDDEDLEIYETDSEDVIIAKYEDRAVLDFCNSILED